MTLAVLMRRFPVGWDTQRSTLDLRVSLGMVSERQWTARREAQTSPERIGPHRSRR